LPHPSSAGPQLKPWAAHVVGVQVGTSGVTHDPRSKIMNSSSFSCGVIGATQTPALQVPPQHWALVVHATLSSLQPPAAPRHVSYVGLFTFVSHRLLQHSTFVSQ
jgi:hypothetical protein